MLQPAVWTGTVASARMRRRTPARFLALEEVGARERAAWHELATRSVEPNPFLEPECVLAAAKHLHESHTALLVVEGSGGEWTGCLPVKRGLRYRGMWFPALSTWRYTYAPLGTPLIAQSAVEPTVAALVEHGLRESRVGVLALPWIGTDGPVEAALHEALAAHRLQPSVERSFTRAVMRRPTLAGGVESLLARGHRRDLERLGRRLAEQLDGTIDVLDASDDASVVDAFLAVEAAGWKGATGTALASRSSHAAFFRELCDGFRKDGRLQLLALGTPDRTVSFKCNLLTEDAVFCFKIAFDEEFSHYRPGLQLEVRMLERFRNDMTQSWMDSCADTNSTLFEHLWPERRRIVSYVIASHRPTAWAIRRSAPVLTR